MMTTHVNANIKNITYIKHFQYELYFCTDANVDLRSISKSKCYTYLSLPRVGSMLHSHRVLITHVVALSSNACFPLQGCHFWPVTTEPFSIPYIISPFYRDHDKLFTTYIVITIWQLVSFINIANIMLIWQTEINTLIKGYVKNTTQS